MRAIVVEETGGPEVLRPTETADPVPGPGEAVGDIAARGVNVIEFYQRTGIYPVTLPWIPGSEGAGVVVPWGGRHRCPWATAWRPSRCAARMRACRGRQRPRARPRRGHP